MESKNIKIVDEHGIDRVGNIVCKIDVNGSDYVFYTIERDIDNDNMFISKLLKNVDGTYNMINIDNDNEKSNVSNIVKGLVKYSIEQDDKTLSSNTVYLNGNSYEIGNVIINKEQYINVPKTYITTVKKNVSKVCSDYYNLDNLKKEEDSIFNDFPVFEPLPSENIQKEEVKEDSNNLNNNVILDTPVVEIPKEELNVDEAVLDSVAESAVMQTPIVNATPIVAEPIANLLEPESAPVVDKPVVESAPVVTEAIPNLLEPEPAPVVDKPVVESVPVVTEAIPNLLEPEPAPVVDKPVVESAPVVTEAIPNLVEPESAPVVDKPVLESAPVVGGPLVFDASKETNLNAVLEEKKSEVTIPASQIEAVREFGEESPVEAPQVLEKPKTRTLSKSGFANGKFVMVIAVLFFVASCVFLGYEIFNYFQTR